MRIRVNCHRLHEPSEKILDRVRKLHKVCMPSDKFHLGDNQFIAEDETGRIVGYAVSSIVGPYNHLDFVGVHPKARGNNIQTQLIDLWALHARGIAKRKLWSFTKPDNWDSIVNFIHCGFRCTEEAPVSLQRQGRVVYFRKTL